MHDRPIHLFRPHSNLAPVIESFHAFVGLFWIMFSCCNDHNGFRDSTENVCQEEVSFFFTTRWSVSLIDIARTVCFWVCETDHVLWQDFWYASDSGRYDV